MNEKLQALAHLVKIEQQAKITESAPALGPDYVSVRLIPGPKYIKLDVVRGGQQSGALMIDQAGNIYGIKAYGVIHRGRPYGTLDTILDWYWGNYYPMPRPDNMPRPILEGGDAFTAPAKLTDHPLQVANILVGSWGYDQTNIDFYQVISRTDKTVTFCETNQNETETGFMCGKCTPVPGSYKNSQKHTRRVDVDEHGRASVSFAKDGEGHRVTLHLWDGTPQNFSSYA